MTSSAPASQAQILALYPALAHVLADQPDPPPWAQGLVVPAHATLFHETQPCGGFPLVLAGEVRVSRASEDGRMLELYRVGPGEVCLVSSACLFGGQPMQARGVSTAPTTLVLVDPPRFRAWLADAAFRDFILGLYALRMADLTALIDGMAFHRLDERLAGSGHAVIVVAEGAGQELLSAPEGRDASGNVRYGDIGTFLRDAIKAHFAGRELSLKYIDPSYMIRSLPANAHDSALCLLLGQAAVHAGMSGRTNMVVGLWNHQLTHVPIALATRARKRIDPEGALWSHVLAATGQPREMR